MGMAVGAALKKIAVALLTDKKVLKSIGVTLLVLAVAVIMPLFAFLALLNGTIELDVGMLQQQIMANLSAEDRAMLEDIESTMEEIRTAFKDAGIRRSTGRRISEEGRCSSDCMECRAGRNCGRSFCCRTTG